MTWSELSEFQRYAARHLIDRRDEKLYRPLALGRTIQRMRRLLRGFHRVRFSPTVGKIQRTLLCRAMWIRFPRSAAKKSAIRTALSQLRQRREDADYRPGIDVNRAAARESWRDFDDNRCSAALKGDS